MYSIFYSTLAFTINQPTNYGIQAKKDVGPLTTTVLTNSVTIIFTVAAVLLIAMLTWGALEWVLSGGDKEAVGSARKRITNALIGLVILGVTFVIARVIGTIVGFNPLQNLPIPSLGG